jgi:hypothetical protein
LLHAARGTLHAAAPRAAARATRPHCVRDDAWLARRIAQICDAGCGWEEDMSLMSGGCSSLGTHTLQQQSWAVPWRWTYTCRPDQQCLCSESLRADAGCSYLDNPNYGATSFDSYPWAMVTLFQAISLEGVRGC